MSEKIRCPHCKRLFIRDPRVKNQRYCGAKACQRARKAEWQRQKMAKDPAYRADQLDSQKIWRENNRAYWRKYRQGHPEYCQRNRLLQKSRDARSKFGDLAKMDASAQRSPFKTGTYYLVPHLAKMDASYHKVQLISVV